MSARTIRGILEDFAANGGTVVLSSHVMDLVERICTDVAIIAAGTVRAAGTLDDVRGGREPGGPVPRPGRRQHRRGGPGVVAHLLRLKLAPAAQRPAAQRRQPSWGWSSACSTAAASWCSALVGAGGPARPGRPRARPHRRRRRRRRPGGGLGAAARPALRRRPHPRPHPVRDLRRPRAHPGRRAGAHRAGRPARGRHRPAGARQRGRRLAVGRRRRWPRSSGARCGLLTCVLLSRIVTAAAVGRPRDPSRPGRRGRSVACCSSSSLGPVIGGLSRRRPRPRARSTGLADVLAWTPLGWAWAPGRRPRRSASGAPGSRGWRSRRPCRLVLLVVWERLLRLGAAQPAVGLHRRRRGVRRARAVRPAARHADGRDRRAGRHLLDPRPALQRAGRS